MSDNRMNDDEPNGRPPKVAGGKTLLMILLVGLCVALFFGSVQRMTLGRVQQLEDWSAFRKMVDEGKIDTVHIQGREVRGTLKDTKQADGVIVTGPEFLSDVDKTWLYEAEKAHGVKVVYKQESIWGAMLLNVLLWIVLPIGLLLFFLTRRTGGASGVFSFGKARNALVDKKKNRTTFNDVAGVDEAKEEVSEIVDFLKNPRKYGRLGGRIPKGVLLIGPPGTGKTLLARAIAGEADAPFYSLSGSDFVEMFVGVGASRVRDLFQQAKENAPSIIFLDELDAVGRRRGTGLGGGHDEREQTLNEILVQMDGMETNHNVIVMASTNRPDVLDPALLRPGRFDRHVYVDMPDLKGREDILRVHARKKKLAPTVDIKQIARATPMFSGADLENLLNEAALHAVRKNKEHIEMDDVEEARDKVTMGREKKSRVTDKKDLLITAWHEAGHTITAWYKKNALNPHKVTIVPRGRSLGATYFMPEKDIFNKTRSELLDELVVAFGGRAAEKLHTDDISSGAKGDIDQATGMARKMVCEWGMSDAVGPINYRAGEETFFLGREIARSQDFSQETQREIDLEVKKLIDGAYKEAVSIVEEHRTEVELIATRLMERETLSRDEIEQLLGKPPLA